MWHMGDGWGWWVVFGTVFMVAFWLIVVWAIGTLAQRPHREAPPAPRTEEPTALQILERRYANGELTDEEFEQKRQRLTGSIQGPRPTSQT